MYRDIAVNKNGDKKCINSGYGGGFRWREYSGVNAAQNNHNQHQSPQRFAKRLHDNLKARALLTGHVLLSSDNSDGNHHDQGENNSRQNARDE